MNPFPTAADAEKGMRFKCRFVTKDAAKSQRLLDNATLGKVAGTSFIVGETRFLPRPLRARRMGG